MSAWHGGPGRAQARRAGRGQRALCQREGVGRWRTLMYSSLRYSFMPGLPLTTRKRVVMMSLALYPMSHSACRGWGAPPGTRRQGCRQRHQPRSTAARHRHGGRQQSGMGLQACGEESTHPAPPRPAAGPAHRHALVRVVDARRAAVLHHAAHQHRVWLVAHAEYGVGVHQSKAVGRGLRPQDRAWGGR